MPIIEALDDHGKSIFAWEAKQGQTYYCLICGCRLHPRHFQKGKDFFYRFPNSEPHGSLHCQQLEAARTVYSLAMLDSPERFFRPLMHVQPIKKAGVVSENCVLETGQEEIVESGPDFAAARSLATILKGNIYHFPADYPLWGDRFLKYFCFSRFFKQFFEADYDPEGLHVYEATFEYFDNINKTLIFKAKWCVGNTCMFFCTITGDELYQEIREQFLKRVIKDDGRTEYVELKINALIAGPWVSEMSERCSVGLNSNICPKFIKNPENISDPKCEKCWGCFRTVIYSKKQIYVLQPKD